jgi:hypothetical protein
MPDPRRSSIIAALPKTSYGKMCEMVKKKRKLKRFSAVQAVKEMARDRIGAPGVSKVVPDSRKQKIDKHKPTLGKMLGEE